MNCTLRDPIELAILTRGTVLSPFCLREIRARCHLHFRYIDARPNSAAKTASLCHSVSASSPAIAEILGGAYIPDGCFPAEHYRGRELAEYMSDVSIIGKAYDNRIRIYTALRRENITVEAYGDHAWPACKHAQKVHGSAFRSVAVSSSINLAANLYNDIAGWTSIRVFLLLACGGFVLINYFPGIEELFENEKHLIWYHDEEEAPGLVKYWLTRREKRAQIAEEGRRLALDRYTLIHTAKSILAMREEQSK